MKVQDWSDSEGVGTVCVAEGRGRMRVEVFGEDLNGACVPLCVC